MSLSIVDLPFRLIGKTVTWLYQRIRTALFGDALIKSHKLWAKRRQLGAEWDKCRAGFEYSLKVSLPLDPEKTPPQIALRQMDKPIASIEFVIAAEAGGAIYQHKVHAIDVGTKPVVISLDAIPQQSVPRIDDEGASFAWDSYSLKNIEVRFLDGAMSHQSATLRSSLTHGWFFSKWGRLRGARVNMNAIAHAQQEIALYFRFRLGQPSIVVYSPIPSRRRPRRWPAKYYLTRPLAWLGQKKRVSRALFWCAIWSGVWQFTEAGDLVRSKHSLAPPE